jgi:hypothetical protein
MHAASRDGEIATEYELSRKPAGQHAMQASEDNIGDENCYVASQLPTKTRTRLSLYPVIQTSMYAMATTFILGCIMQRRIFASLQGSLFFSL